MKVIIFSIMIIPALLATLLLTRCNWSECNHWEMIEVNYADWNELIKADSNSRLWLPPILTESTNSIRGKHDLDTNRVWGTASISSRDINKLVLNIKNDQDLLSKFQKSGSCFEPRFLPHNDMFYFVEKDHRTNAFYWFYAIDQKAGVIFFMGAYP